MEGIINLDKPPGLTSARAVDRVKRLLPRGTKIGHAGTLDPFATGVLLLLIGKATKACERMMDAPKQYECTLKLGSTTPTFDPESEEIAFADSIRPPVPKEIEDALTAFTGPIMQRPPAYSAIKVGGQRAYDLMRKGAEVEIEPRQVQVYSIRRLDYCWPTLTLSIDCGRGTYIRAIARDLGEKLATGAYLTALRRTRIGSFDVKNAATLESLAAPGQIAASLMPVA
ncbi:MAG TPA: tRNA pseudouridine(55) synthase TruB [Tepidisphaeraceae bacterium]|nr:tRNA pseudouridine(55) synthase TruB [Tepidisphaeraceae bacterium]